MGFMNILRPGINRRRRSWSRVHRTNSKESEEGYGNETDVIKTVTKIKGWLITNEIDVDITSAKRLSVLKY